MRQLLVIGAIVCLQATSLIAQDQPGTIRVVVLAEDMPVE
jgi:hypothetical protein